MKRKNIMQAVTVLVTVAVVGIGANAFAGKGNGAGGRGSQGGWNGPCWTGTNLSDGDIEKLQAEQQAFFSATADLRRQIRQKRLTLRAELAEKEPDAAVAKSVQKALTDLQAQLDQKRLAHMIEMKKINPDAGGRWMGAGDERGPGRGWHHGYRSGRGSGPGRCW